MTRLAQIELMDFSAPADRAPGLITRLRRHFASVEAAMAGQARLASLAPETLRDIGLSPEDLTGAPSHDPALPFFMQASFGRHNP
jgi:uncharacterized protein YjiS (DUF1127 family)